MDLTYKQITMGLINAFTFRRISASCVGFVLCVFSIHAQTSVASSGGSVTGSGGSVSYTIGQPVYTTVTGSNGSIAQGVQQPYEISVISALNEVVKVELSCSVYPNPASDFLMLKIESNVPRDFSYILMDSEAKALVTNKVESRETKISLKDLVPAIYFLKVIKVNGSADSKEIKTFKIVKH